VTEEEVRAAVMRAYQAKYPRWRKLQVPSVQQSTHGVFYCLVEATDEDRVDVEEVCIVDQKGTVRIFDGTGDLVYNLANMRGALLSYFSPSVIGGTAFLVTLIAVIAFTRVPTVNKDGFEALTHVLSLAVGFYFGNQARR
jgi:hypothetical protein